MAEEELSVCRGGHTESVIPCSQGYCVKPNYQSSNRSSESVTTWMIRQTVAGWLHRGYLRESDRGQMVCNIFVSGP